MSPTVASTIAPLLAPAARFLSLSIQLLDIVTVGSGALDDVVYSAYYASVIMDGAQYAELGFCHKRRPHLDRSLCNT